MTLNLNRNVLYIGLTVIAFAVALGLGVYFGRGAGTPGGTTQVVPTAMPGAVDSSLSAIPSVVAPTADPAFASLPRIEIADAFARFEKGDALFVDARSAAEFAQEHVPGAVNIPYTEAEARMGELPKDKDIIVYCA